MAATYAGPGTSGDLRPDPAVIESWLNWWFQSCNKGHIEIAWTDPSDGSVNRARHFPLGATGEREAARFAAALNEIPGTNVYFGCSTVTPPDSTGPRRASDREAVQTPGLWVDGDTLEHVAKLSNVEHLLRPSAIVVTSDIPQRRQHVYIRLTEPIAPDRAKPANQRLVALYGGSRESVNAARVLRLPGCLAWPYKPGRQIEVIRLERGPDSYAWSRVDFALPQLEAEQPAGAAAPTGPTVRQAAAEIVATIREGNWHEPVMRLVASMIQAGLPDAMIHLIDASVTLPSWSIDQTYDDVQKLIDSGRARFGVPETGYAPDRVADARDAFAMAPLPPEVGATSAVAGPPVAGVSDESQRLKVLRIDEALALRGAPPEWLIDGFLPRGATVLVTGLPGVGKSPLVQLWVALLGAGGEWLGKPVKQAKILYWAAESVSQTARNIGGFLGDVVGATAAEAAEAFREQIHILDLGGLTLEQHASAVVELLDREGPYDVLVIDTVRAASVGGVTKDEDMRLVQQAIELVRRGRPRLTVLPIHHSPKGDPEGASGSNRLEGMSDVLLNVTAMTRGGKGGESGLVVANKLAWSTPDADGWQSAVARLICPRMKMWETPPPLLLQLANKGPDLRLTAGAEADGAREFSETPVPGEDEGVGFAGGNAPRPPDGRSEALESAVCALLTEPQSFVELLDAAEGFGLVDDRRSGRKSRALTAAIEALLKRGIVAPEGSTRNLRYRLTRRF